MRYSSTLAIATVVALPFAAAQNMANLPNCAQPAIEASVAHATCALTDYTCICGSPSFIKGIKSQIQSSCSSSDQKATLDFAKQVCSAAGAELKIDDDSSSDSPSGGGAAAAAPATSAAAAAAAAAPAASESAAAAPAASGAEDAASASAMTAPTSPPYPVDSGNGTIGGMNGSNSSTTPFLGAANGRQSAAALASTVALGLIGGLVFGVL